jgi:hypothetical protein
VRLDVVRRQVQQRDPAGLVEPEDAVDGRLERPFINSSRINVTPGDQRRPGIGCVHRS